MAEDIRNSDAGPIDLPSNEALRMPPQAEMQFLLEMEQAYNHEKFEVIEENFDRLQRLVEDCQDRIQALAMIQQRARQVMQRQEPPNLPFTEEPETL